MIYHIIIAGAGNATDQKIGKIEADLKAFKEASVDGFGSRASGGSHRKRNTWGTITSRQTKH